MVQETSNVISSLGATWGQIVNVLPSIGASALLLLVGWLIARLGRRWSIKLFRLLRVDTLAENIGIEGFLMQGGIQFTAVTLLGGAIYWGVLFLTFVALLNTLAVPAGVELLERIVLFIPNVLVAVIVLIFGTVTSRFVGSVTFTYLNNVGSKGAAAIAATARFAMLGFVIAIAVEQLALKSEILVSGFQIAFGAVCLALALAFGLGGREWAGRILDRFWKV
ncbi:MAG: hypothetical protein O2973_03520 [Gemmatimonadetes bacterium]|nr:hypothetical protein [Gemmatimonadota bacterium]